MSLCGRSFSLTVDMDKFNEKYDIDRRICKSSGGYIWIGKYNHFASFAW